MKHRGWAGGACVALVALIGCCLAGAAAERVADPADGAKESREAKEPRDFSGKYLAAGTSAGSRGYKAMVEITREGDAYQVLWVIGPREAYMGVGIAEGEGLCVGWSSQQLPGVCVYKPEKDLLVGRWTAPGAGGKIFKETLTPVK